MNQISRVKTAGRKPARKTNRPNAPVAQSQVRSIPRIARLAGGDRASRSRRHSAIFDLIDIMARLRAPNGCPWDREQDHRTLRFHAVEEVYELLDAIEADDDHEMVEELGDLLLQIVFHCQLASERAAFDFETVARHIADKLIRRHPHVFGDSKVSTVAGVWTQWDQIKHAEKAGTRHERPSALDGIPRHLPALLRAEKLVKKARKAGLTEERGNSRRKLSRRTLARELFALAEFAQRQGWNAEDLLRTETARRERAWRKAEPRKRLSKQPDSVGTSGDSPESSPANPRS